MAKQRKGGGITWTNETWNPIRGCTVVSEGCRNCYAMTVAARFSEEGQAYAGLAYRNDSGAHWTNKVSFIEKHLMDPLRWQRPRLVFVNSMSDLFHVSVPDEWIDCIFAVMAMAPQHTFQVLTKRPDRMRDYMLKLQRAADDHAPNTVEKSFSPSQVLNLRMLAKSKSPGGLFGRAFSAPWPLPNVLLGVSVEDQPTADERIPVLMETPAALRWVSAEPLLGPMSLEAWLCSCPVQCEPRSLSCSLDGYLDWVVTGGESGAGARPMHPDWPRKHRDECKAAGVPFFFKQWGEWLPLSQQRRASLFEVQRHIWPDGREYDGRELMTPSCAQVSRAGKKRAGDLLDGVRHHEFPKVV